MTEEKKEQPKNVAVDLECDDEFEEFGNEGASSPTDCPAHLPRAQISPLPLGLPPLAPVLTQPPRNARSRMRRVGPRGGGRRGREAVGRGLGRYRRQR
jgi:hypothetical protein